MKKFTITIGIPAYNEEANIENMLKSVLKQKGNSFVLERILIVLDGCTDNTFKIANSIAKKDRRIKVVHDGKRTGKAIRINNILNMNKSDICLFLDADIVISNNNFLNELVKQFRNSKVGLVSGNDIPLSANTFIGKVIVKTIDIWLETRKNINNGVNIHNNHGTVMAVSKKFASILKLPSVIGDDDFIYLTSKKNKFQFRFSKEAIVFYRPPSDLKDYFNQSSRFLNQKHEMASIFGNWIYNEYKVPTKYKALGLINSFIKNPIFFIFALGLLFFGRAVQNKFLEDMSNGYWRTINSTKNIN